MSHVARAVALLAQAVDAGSQAQAACSAADQHARVMRDTYTSIAEESGNEAPSVATRHVLDAQEALLDVSNRLHGAAEVVRTYVQQIAPGLVGGLRSDSVYRPSGTELVELGPPRTRRGRRSTEFTRFITSNQGDISDAGKSIGRQMDALAGGFKQLPPPPSSTQAVARQPVQDPVPVARSLPPAGVSGGGVFDFSLAFISVAVAARQAARRLGQMMRSIRLDHRAP